MAEHLWLQPLERHLNRRIGESASASARLASLEGRELGITVHGAPVGLRLAVRDDRLLVHTGAGTETPPDAEVSGSVVALAQLATGAGAGLLRDGSVTIRGDAEVAQAFQALLEAARPDWEDELSRLTGDVAAHQLGRGVRAVRDFGTRVAGSLAHSLGDYLQHESRDLVARDEVAEFSAGVDRLRDDLARLEARVARLRRNVEREHDR